MINYGIYTKSGSFELISLQKALITTQTRLISLSFIPAFAFNSHFVDDYRA